MYLTIVCAECDEEFLADGQRPHWDCPSCGHQIENRRYPFLTGSLVAAYVNPTTEDWRGRHDALLDQARTRIVELEGTIARLQDELEALRRGESRAQVLSSGAEPIAEVTVVGAGAKGPIRQAGAPIRGPARPSLVSNPDSTEGDG